MALTSGRSLLTFVSKPSIFCKFSSGSSFEQIWISAIFIKISISYIFLKIPSIIREMMKNIILNILKFSFAIGLVYWLVNSGKLDFSLAKDIFRNPIFVMSIILFMFLDQVLVAYRWKIILMTKSHRKKDTHRYIFVNNYILHIWCKWCKMVRVN